MKITFEQYHFGKWTDEKFFLQCRLLKDKYASQDNYLKEPARMKYRAEEWEIIEEFSKDVEIYYHPETMEYEVNLL